MANLTADHFKTWVTRAELEAITGKCDRVNREHIEQMRRDGSPIINNRDGKGYKMAETPEELDQFLKMEYWAKIKKMIGTANAMTSYFSQNGQMRIAGL